MSKLLLAKRVRSMMFLAIAGLAVTSLWAQEAAVPEIRIAIVGDPVHQIPWTEEVMERLRNIGFNAVQLNLAWTPRPVGEPVNLFEVVTVPGDPESADVGERRAELKRRVALAHRHGLRTLFQFGSPYMGRNPYTRETPPVPAAAENRIDDVTFDSWYDVRNPKVRDHELALLKEFRRQFPDVEDILVYTYDQDAWQTPEFQYSRFSYGIPLASRLPEYLAALHKVWTEGRTGRSRMWWEPFHLSAGQVYAMLPKLPKSDFGLMIHANIAEVQLAAPVDVWFRNTARIAGELGIPVVAEGFFASRTEELEPLSIPAPRLVDEQYGAITRVPGITGIKEYYGIDTTVPDLDLDLLQVRLHEPSRSTEELLEAITRRFGAAQRDVLAFLALLAEAYQTYPWDASWAARAVGRASIDHGWRGATIRWGLVPTPLWESTSHAHFMQGNDRQPHFWMLEDVQLRCQSTAELLDKAEELLRRFGSQLPTPADRTYFDQIGKDANFMEHVVRSYALHLRETNVAQMLRHDLAAGRPMTQALVSELRSLLEADVANQGGHGRVVEMLRLYQDDPREFVRRYLVPVPDLPSFSMSPDLPPVERAPPEKGFFSLTTR